MNWVGGSRSRFMKSSDMKKQREFFEKKKRQKKLNNPGPPASPKQSNTANIDLLTMFIVNQIALKKEHAGKPKISHMDSTKETPKSVGHKPINLPMSPCSPSRLNLVQSDSHYSDHAVGLKKRKQSLLEEFRFRKLSPVLEAIQSDNSASDYKHRHHHHQSSISSFSSASSTSSEAFQPRPPTYISPPPLWEPSCPQTSPYEYEPWTVHQTQTAQISPAAGAQFGSILQSQENNGPSIHSAGEYPSGNPQQEEPLFLGFHNEEDEGQDLFSERMIKIHLQKETPSACTSANDYMETHSRDNSADFLPQGSRYSDFIPCSTRSSFSENACKIPIGYSPREGCISLHTGNEQYRESPSSHLLMHHCGDTPAIRDQYCLKGTSAARQVMSFTPKVTCNNHDSTERERETLKPRTDTQMVKIPEETSIRTQDMGTQTAPVYTLTSQDASVQCCLLKTERRQSTSTEHKAFIHQNSTGKGKKARTSTTRRQTGKSNENLPIVTQCALSENHKVKWNTPWKTSITRQATHHATQAIAGQESSCKSESQACTNKHSPPILHSSHAYALESNGSPSGNTVVRGERCEGHEEESVNQNPAENAWSTEERSRERGVNWASGETETLQEIADILLMLKQKNKH